MLKLREKCASRRRKSKGKKTFLFEREISYFFFSNSLLVRSCAYSVFFFLCLKTVYVSYFSYHHHHHHCRHDFMSFSFLILCMREIKRKEKYFPKRQLRAILSILDIVMLKKRIHNFFLFYSTDFCLYLKF